MPRGWRRGSSSGSVKSWFSSSRGFEEFGSGVLLVSLWGLGFRGFRGFRGLGGLGGFSDLGLLGFRVWGVLGFEGLRVQGLGL